MHNSPNGSADLPLFGSAGARIGSMEYDEDGSLALARVLSLIGDKRKPDVLQKSDAGGGDFDASHLDGSWFLQLMPRGPHTHMEMRGPMRIEVAPPKLRISGDIYVRKPVADGAPIEILRPITEHPLLFGDNWYPQLPIVDYSWYFKSIGVTFEAGMLVFKFERHLWNRTTQEFIGQENSGKDNGFMEFNCAAAESLSHPLLPQPTLQIKGRAHVGGEIYDAFVTKTSPYYRGCAVEVDVMANRDFPLGASTDTSISFTNIYRTAGMDCQLTVDNRNIPEDADLSTIELQTALSTHRRPLGVNEEWRLWLLIGSAQGDLFGLMFDDSDPYREGTCGFFDPRLPNDPHVAAAARNKKLGEVPEAFLRTLVHEAGHAFNLFHPKHDVHSVPIGTSIMNQTGDVMGFATSTDPYPGNITFAFDDHNRTSLIHSPDPQVAPGWKRFGWGHGSLSHGISEPIDAMGFLQGGAVASDFVLHLVLPDVIYRGQFVTAQFTVTNTGSRARPITSALNLSEGDLRLLLKPPHEELHDVRDVIIACGDRAMTMLAPGESLRGVAQVFYTNIGFTFHQTGRYQISAELDPGDGSGATVRSASHAVIVRAPVTPEEEAIARLSLTPGVGRAFAFGDYGLDQDARQNLDALAHQYAASDNGVAANLTLANSHSCNLRDLWTGSVTRHADEAVASMHFERGAAAKAGDPSGLARAAAAIAAPTESRAPVLDMADGWLKRINRVPATEPLAADARRAAAPGDARLWTAADDARLAATADGMIRRAAASEGVSSQAADAQGLLRQCRRSMAGGDSPGEQVSAMQSKGAPSASDLLVTLDIREPIVVGLSVIARIRVINHSQMPCTTSARLNLMEGDLTLIIQGPDGQTRTIKGWQADTALRRATLEPGEEIVNGINLLSTDAGPVFPVPGKYHMMAEFTISPQQAAVRSDPVVVSARLPESDDEREVARLLQDTALRNAILLAKPASAPEALQTLATRFAATPDGMLAALLVSEGDTGQTLAGQAVDSGTPVTPESLALAVAMLQTPFSHVGRQIADRFMADLETGTVRGDDTMLRNALTMAAQIAKRQPFKRQ